MKTFLYIIPIGILLAYSQMPSEAQIITLPFEEQIMSYSVPVLPVPLKPIEVKSDELASRNVIRVVNEERQRHGLSALKENQLLSVAALKHIEDMRDGNYFAHVSPTLISYADFISQAGYGFLYAGENIAAASPEWTASRTLKAWNDSPTHKANILKPEYTETGVAMVEGIRCLDKKTQTETKCVLVIQMFGHSK
jgi:uncharacterized protein YkwD